MQLTERGREDSKWINVIVVKVKLPSFLEHNVEHSGSIRAGISFPVEKLLT
jgi:hypothetical protein